MIRLPDIFIVTGLVALMGGVYRLFGLDVSLIVGGVLLYRVGGVSIPEPIGCVDYLR
jgi:hypothetical protein